MPRLACGGAALCGLVIVLEQNYSSILPSPSPSPSLSSLSSYLSSFPPSALSLPPAPDDDSGQIHFCVAAPWHSGASPQSEVRLAVAVQARGCGQRSSTLVRRPIHSQRRLSSTGRPSAHQVSLFLVFPSRRLRERHKARPALRARSWLSFPRGNFPRDSPLFWWPQNHITPARLAHPGTATKLIAPSVTYPLPITQLATSTNRATGFMQRALGRTPRAGVSTVLSSPSLHTTLTLHGC